jgi:hypothetical protein
VASNGTDDFHILKAGAAVLGGDVMPSEVIDEAPERTEEGRTIEMLIDRTHQDSLSAAMRQPRERRLVRHPAREPQSIDERLLVARIRKEAATAEGRPQACVMNGDDGPETRRHVAC